MQALGGAVRLELHQSLGLDLADTLAGDTELLADLLEGARAAVLEAKTKLEDVALAMGEEAEHEDDLLALHDLADLLGGRDGILVFDEVEERHASADVPLGDGDHEAQVGLDELALGRYVAPLDAPGQRDLFDGGEQRHLAHLHEVHAHGIAARRLD